MKDMKKENIVKFLYFISIILIIGFGIRVGADYLKYNTINHSAPFYAFVIVRMIEFILPSVIVFIIARMIKNKSDKSKL